MEISPARLFRRKIWCVGTSTSVLFPALLGGWILYPPTSFWSAAIGWSAVAVSAVSAFRQWKDHERLTEIAYRDLQKRTREVRMREIRELRRSLRSDRDPRTSNMLKRLQRIYDRLLESERAGIDPVYKEVSVQANRLHQSCMELLRMSLRLWKASREVTTESVRKQLETSRESSINEVQEGIINLERSLDHLQTSELRGGASDEVNAARLRKELDEGLNVARRVENRIRSLDSELGDSSGEHRSEDFQDRRSD